MFQPYVYAPATPRANGGVQQQQAAPPPEAKNASLVVPICREISLATITSVAEPGPATIYQNDYFLAHLTEASVQRFILTCKDPVIQRYGFKMQLISQFEQEIKELTDWKSYGTLPTSAEPLEDVIENVTGTLMLRIRCISQATVVFVTLEALISQVY